MTKLTLEQQKELTESKLVDIAFGHTSTGFIFERKDKTLYGFRIKSQDIELCEFSKK